MLEGLWYGTLWVAPAFGGPLETVGNPPAALLHTPGDAGDLSATVVRILKDQELADELVRRGKEGAAKFSREGLWPELKRHYRRVVVPRSKANGKYDYDLSNYSQLQHPGVLLDCLRSVYASRGDIEAEVFVVDNASTDGTVDAIAQRVPQVHCYRQRDECRVQPSK